MVVSVLTLNIDDQSLNPAKVYYFQRKLKEKQAGNSPFIKPNINCLFCKPIIFVLPETNRKIKFRLKVKS